MEDKKVVDWKEKQTQEEQVTEKAGWKSKQEERKKNEIKSGSQIRLRVK